MPKFHIECSKCQADIAFDPDEIDALAAYIERECDRAAEESVDGTAQSTRREVEEEFEEYIDPTMLTEGGRPLLELAIAIRRGDRAEAELQLDRIAHELGTQAIEDVEQGRYSLRAKVAA